MELCKEQVQNRGTGPGGLSDMAEVEYKCIECGAMEHFPPEKNGISCKGCGSRIFAKPRRPGHKTLDAI
ncbi:uncharacterized protein METZ01_LOCUS394202 [marine metagenome]|uniref:DNA-directed RNA polymerase subunit P n=1 Tax=marine metagenome TaxID=408172 RepID=A0A382V627_9ZZZZ